MKVETLCRFLKSLGETLRDSGSKRTADELNELCDGLKAFANYSLRDFADLVRKTDDYAKTGVIPLQAKSRGGSRPIDQERVKDAAQLYSSLFERAIDRDVDYSAIEREIKKLEKALTKDEALALAKEVNITVPKRTKKAAFEEIQHRIFQRKQSYERTRF